MKKIVVLSIETPHHIYFISRLLQGGISIDAVIYETSILKPPFKVGPFFEKEQEEFERERFFIGIPATLPDTLKVHYVETVNTEEVKEIMSIYGPDLGIVFWLR